MGRLASVILALAALLTAGVARTARGQVMSESLPEILSFRALAADLRTADVTVEPETLVAVYIPFVIAWLDEQEQIRAALARAAGTRSDFEVIPTAEEIRRAVNAARRARSAHEARVDRFFLTLNESLPESEQAKSAVVQGWWRIAAANPRHTSISGLSIDDVGELLRRHPIAPESRGAIIAALATNEAARREAYRRLDRAIGDARIARSALADAEGRSGADAEGSMDFEFRLRYQRTGMPDPAVVAALLDAQLAAFDTVAPHLTEEVRRTLFDELVRQQMGDEMRGRELQLPNLGVHTPHLDCPAQAGQALLAWKHLPSEARDPVHGLLKEWLAQDDAIVRAYFMERNTTMHRGTWPDSFSRPIEVQARRSELAREFLPRLTEVSGATWLLEPASEPVERNESNLLAADRALVGRPAPGVATPLLLSPTLQRQRLLPVNEEAALRREFTEPLLELIALDDPAAAATAEAIIADLLRDHAEAWALRVAPEIRRIEEAQGSIGRGTPEEHGAALETTQLRRRLAFEAAQEIDRALIESARAALPEGIEPSLRRWFASRRFTEGLSRIELDLPLGGSLPLEYIGGATVDPANLPVARGVAPATRRAIDIELADAWPQLAEQAIEALALRQRIHAARLDRRSGAFIDPVESEQATRASDIALRSTIDAWRATEDALEPRMLAAAGAAAEEVVRALEEARFPTACSALVRIRQLRDELAAVPDFSGRDDLLATLDEASDQVRRIVRRVIALSHARQSIADLPDGASWHFEQGRSWRRKDLITGTNEISMLLWWLVAQRMPPERAEHSPLLTQVIRLYAPPQEGGTTP